MATVMQSKMAYTWGDVICICAEYLIQLLLVRFNVIYIGYIYDDILTFQNRDVPRTLFNNAEKHLLHGIWD